MIESPLIIIYVSCHNVQLIVCISIFSSGTGGLKMERNSCGRPMMTEFQCCLEEEPLLSLSPEMKMLVSFMISQSRHGFALPQHGVVARGLHNHSRGLLPGVCLTQQGVVATGCINQQGKLFVSRYQYNFLQRRHQHSY